MGIVCCHCGSELQSELRDERCNIPSGKHATNMSLKLLQIHRARISAQTKQKDILKVTQIQLFLIELFFALLPLSLFIHSFTD